MPRTSNSYTGGSNRKRPAQRRGRRDLRRPLIAFFFGILVTAAAFPAYLYFGHPPVAVADPPAFWEGLVQRTAVRRRIEREAKPAPFNANEDSFESAARVYRNQCAQCHGAPSQDAAIATGMVPRPPQFFTRDRVAIAAKSPGALYWPTAFGIRRSGMPAYRRMLTNTQLWQLALLLHSADQDLPDPVRNLLAPALPPTALTGPAASALTGTARPGR